MNVNYHRNISPVHILNIHSFAHPPHLASSGPETHSAAAVAPEQLDACRPAQTLALAGRGNLHPRHVVAVVVDASAGGFVLAVLVVLVVAAGSVVAVVAVAVEGVVNLVVVALLGAPEVVLAGGVADLGRTTPALLAAGVAGSHPHLDLLLLRVAGVAVVDTVADRLHADDRQKECVQIGAC